MAKIKYSDLIEQTFDFPQEEFTYDENGLSFHGISQMELVERFGTPLKYTYLPKISQNISRAREWFASAMAKCDYKGSYHYCYVTKSSHYSHVLNEVLKSKADLETSSPIDLSIMKKLYEQGLIDVDQVILFNGFKSDLYLQKIGELINLGFHNTITIVDHAEEIQKLKTYTSKKIKIGIRIASEEEPKFEFYTSRLGIGYRDILSFYREQIESDPQLDMAMLHFFINTGINDNAYYWNELGKCLKVLSDLKKICPSLRALNIGGGFPIKNSLSFNYDYAYLVEEIISLIKAECVESGIEEPAIYTEFGTFSVGESGAVLYKILYQKQQNDREKWNMIDGSFMTTLPDTWALNKRFVMLPLNRWDDTYERVFLGGLTCDSDDYYNHEQHVNAIYLPVFKKDEPLYIGFFNTGAYQDTIGGVGGLHHCLIPDPQHVLIDRDENGELTYKVFASQQDESVMMNILGYK